MSDKSEDGLLPKVMLVDDDEDVREILGETLRSNHYDVQVCASGMQAIASITEDTRIVILDMMMPDMDGAETYRALQKKHPGIPVIFYSAYKTLLDLNKLGPIKPFGFVDKGASGSRHRLLELVRSAVNPG